jgi:8-amino-7-oxononanoate synthase
MGDALDWLSDAAEDRARRGLHRELVPRGPGSSDVLDLAGNDYLALAREPAVIEAAVAAARAYGAGSTGSRLVTGTTALHQHLEETLAQFVGTETGLVFSSGYAANLGGVTALSGSGSLIVSDAGNHASLVDACRLSRARVVVVPTGDVQAVDDALRTRPERRALVVTDGVFSVSGECAPVAELHQVARENGAALFIDEAHALGVVGADGTGVSAAAGIAGEPDVVITVTLSKSLGSQGGAVLGTRLVQAHLIDTARAFIFDTALAPSCAGAALAALGLVTPQRVGALHRVVNGLAFQLHLPPTKAAVLPVPVGDPAAAVAARDACARQSVRVGCFRPPSVPVGGSCLRLTGSATLTEGEVQRAASVVSAAVTAGTAGAA